MNYAIGIDLGGTNIKGIVVTPSGKVLAEVALPTGDTGKHDWTGNVREVFNQLRAEVKSPPNWIGLSAPGLPARDQRSIAFLPVRLRGIEGLEWGKFFDVAQPVPVLNDAQAALLGEIWRGAACRSRNVLLLTLGTGVGGAAVIDGNLLRGQFKGERVFFADCGIRPAGRPIEFGDERLAVFYPDLIHPIFIAVQRQHPAVAAMPHGLDRVQHGFGR